MSILNIVYAQALDGQPHAIAAIRDMLKKSTGEEFTSELTKVNEAIIKTTILSKLSKQGIKESVMTGIFEDAYRLGIDLLREG